MRNVTLIDLSLSLNIKRVRSGVTEAWADKLAALSSNASVVAPNLAEQSKSDMDHSLITLLVS
ncbi:hypothetical protein EcE24377A_2633 [Escherichia coli O139:H28 str. E24377A]|uniref:Uncharacterized protein n=1 Tax=Escherichia coli O139:H28 (strain E24377A / ETEC) TaxID=331111 RepID=A7ZPF3_ECO24|nr:hypothetical protein EcE24377A_2633 [Escherichia coli O139:H28 str. E24377A]